jgi:hypothetical protein
MKFKKLLVVSICAGLVLNTGLCAQAAEPLTDSEIDIMYSNFKEQTIQIPSKKEDQLSIFFDKLRELESIVYDCLVRGVKGINPGDDTVHFISDKFGIYRIKENTLYTKDRELISLMNKCGIRLYMLKQVGWNIEIASHLGPSMITRLKRKGVAWTIWRRAEEYPTKLLPKLANGTFIISDDVFPDWG